MLSCSKQESTPARVDSGHAADTGDSPADSPILRDGGANVADAGDDTPLPDEVLSVPGPVLTVNSGEEDTVCIDVRLGNADTIYVKGIRAHLSEGSHHIIFYKSARTVPSPEPEPCTPFIDVETLSSSGAPLFIAQQRETQIDFPPGVALALEADQMVRIEIHYINVGHRPINVQGTIDLVLDPSSPDSITRADLMFWGTTRISIPPRSKDTARFFGLVPAGPREPLSVFGITSHTHQLGELATIERTDDEDVPGEILHTSTSWAEPPLDMFDPPLVFDGNDGLLLTCQYANTTNEWISFGEGFNNEMCFLWAYYYPSRGLLMAFD